MAIYIIMRKKGSKRWTSVYQPKKGKTSSKISSELRKGLSKQLEFRLVNFEQLQKIIMQQRPSTPKKAVKKRKRAVKRRKVRSRIKRKSSRRRK